MPLTEKQESFARRVALEGMSAAEAYRSTYNAARMNTNGVYVEASKLMAHPKVSARVAELRERKVQESGLTAQRVIDGLLEIAEGGKSESARVQAYNSLGKHLGMFTDKTEITGADGGPIVIERPTREL